MDKHNVATAIDTHTHDTHKGRAHKSYVDLSAKVRKLY